MEYFNEKISYLRGLCDGSGYEENSKEGKIFHSILDLLDDFALCMESFIEDGEEQPQYEFSCICTNCSEEFNVDELDLNGIEEVECPKCHNIIPCGIMDIDDLKF